MGQNMRLVRNPIRANQGAAKLPFVIALLTVSVFINYIDRGNLSIAAPLLQQELQLSPAQLGILLSAFFWTYTALQVPVGWLIDRANVNYVLAAGFLAWSLATAATGLVNGFAALLALRFLLGAGESVAFPCYSKILAFHCPERHRGVGNAIICAGLAAGPAFGTFAGGVLMARIGWRPVFLGLGIVSLLWLPAWLNWMPRAPLKRGSDGSNLSIWAIVEHRSFWGAAIGHFCGNYVLYFAVTWLPYYLVHERHFSMRAMAATGGLFFLVYALSSTATGAVTDHLIRRGGGVSVVRKAAMGIGYATAAVAIALCAMAGRGTFQPWLMLAAAGSGMGGSGTFAFPQILGGTHAAGKWTGLQNFLANFAGIAGPTLTGFVVGWTGSFLLPFVLTAIIALVGAFSWVFLVPELKQVIADNDIVLAAAH